MYNNPYIKFISSIVQLDQINMVPCTKYTTVQQNTLAKSCFTSYNKHTTMYIWPPCIKQIKYERNNQTKLLSPQLILFVVACLQICTIINVLVSLRELELLWIECQKHTRCFLEPIQLLPHPGLACGRSTHICHLEQAGSPGSCRLTWPLAGTRLAPDPGCSELGQNQKYFYLSFTTFLKVAYNCSL